MYSTVRPQAASLDVSARGASRLDDGDAEDTRRGVRLPCALRAVLVLAVVVGGILVGFRATAAEKPAALAPLRELPPPQPLAEVADGLPNPPIVVAATPGVSSLHVHFTQRRGVSCRATGANQVPAQIQQDAPTCWSREQMLVHASRSGQCFFAAKEAVTLGGEPCSPSMNFCSEPLTMLPSASHEVYSTCDDTKLAELAPTAFKRDQPRAAPSVVPLPPPPPPPPPPAAARITTAPPPRIEEQSASSIRSESLPPPSPRSPKARAFVRIETGGRGFVRGTEPYRFFGINLWYGAHLGCLCEGGDRARLVRELDALHGLGVRNVRVMASSQGPDTRPYRAVPSMQPSPEELNRRILEGLDFLLVELAKRDLTVVLVLNNFMPWSGGMAQYVAWASQTSIPYAGEMTNWDGYFQYTQQFYLLDDAMAASYTVAEAVVRRHNSLSGVAYADDPTIMAWELAQMPRAMRVQHEYRNWVRRFSRRIKNWDANHLITLGSEGNTPFPEYVGNSFTADHSPDEIDYTTVHIWPQDWRWYDPDGASTSSVLRAVTKAKAYLLDHVDAAEKMRKPLVLEEFGLARDESALHPGTPTDRRDEWFMAVCNEVAARTPARTPLRAEELPPRVCRCSH